MPLFSLDHLTVDIRTPEGVIRPVDDVSWSVDAGETVALVGESGSGKSVTALAALGLLPPATTRLSAGDVVYKGQSLLNADEETLRRIRGAEVGMVFQEPMTSLNPVRSIGHQITEHVRLHLGVGKREAFERAEELLSRVGIAEPRERLSQYPHHLSGGMRQRVMIAIALACGPQLIIADEPTTALDVTIQGQILELLRDLAETDGVALVLITHNLGIVARYAHRVNVMYGGRIIESGDAEVIYERARHPYTMALLNSVPRLDRARGELLNPIPGSPPDPGESISGCRFRPRCAYATEGCGQEKPPIETYDSGHTVACLNARALELSA